MVWGWVTELPGFLHHHPAIDRLGNRCGLAGQREPGLFEAGLRHDLFAIGLRQQREMFVAAEDEIDQLAADAGVRIREIDEKVLVVGEEPIDRHVAVGLGDPDTPTRLQRPVHVLEVPNQQLVGKVFDNMIRIEDIDAAVAERQQVLHPSPDIDPRRNQICIEVDPAVEIILLPGPQMNLDQLFIAGCRRTK